ncbi:MAG: hypothetical protein QM831_18955 [Kofleriaceae bacterium]
MSNDELNSDDEALVAKLRALPQEGVEPDWAKLSAAINVAVGPRVPSPWWRNWRWMVPVGAFASLTAAAMIWLVANHGTNHTPMIEMPIAHTEPAPAPAAEEKGTVYLDGEAVDVQDVDPSVLLDDSDEFADGLMPGSDLRWVDSLDDHALDKVEAYLDHKKHGKG